MNIVNLTPHPITIMAEDGLTVIASRPAAPRGEVARVETVNEVVGTIGGIPIMRTRWGQIIGLPAYKAGTYHVVSVIVAETAVDSGRQSDDLVVPGDQVRDASGRIVGCRGLTLAVTSSPAMSGQRAHKAAMAAHRRTDPECDNLRPEPEAIAVEMENLLVAFDSWVAEAGRLRLEGGWAHLATEAHGSLRCGLIGIAKRAVTQFLSEPHPNLTPQAIRAEAVSRLVAAIEQHADRLPLGHTGRDYVAGWPGREVTLPTLTD